MRQLFVINPVKSGKLPVVEYWTKRGKTNYHLTAWIDPPGTWYDDEYNVHIDGCDYPYSSMDECLARIKYFFEPEEVEIQFANIDYNTIIDY